MADQTWKDRLRGNPIPWLLESQPWTRLRTLIDLQSESDDSSVVRQAQADLFSHPQIISLINMAQSWFPQSITRHNVPHLSHYYLSMLADLGVTASHPGMANVWEKAQTRLNQDLFTVRQTLPKKGTPMGQHNPHAEEWHAMPCDSPLITAAFLKMGFEHPKIAASIQAIETRWTEKNDWFCHFFFVNGQHKKFNVGCPMAGLMALQLFSHVPRLLKSKAAENAFEPIRFHQAYGKSIYFFGRSKRFWTFKFPFVWYNALYVADVLTRYQWMREEPVVKELIEWIESSQDELGRFKPTSMFRCHKEWEFSNKRDASPWITFLCLRILKRHYS